jgi:hypothetical protein
VKVAMAAFYVDWHHSKRQGKVRGEQGSNSQQGNCTRQNWKTLSEKYEQNLTKNHAI